MPAWTLASATAALVLLLSMNATAAEQAPAPEGHAAAPRAAEQIVVADAPQASTEDVPSAAETTSIAEAADDAPAAEPEASRVSLGAGIDFGNQYWFRGIVQETKDLIMQPWIEVGVSLYDGGDSALSGVSMSLGLWNSFHSGPTRLASTATVRSWYESDFYAGVSVSLLGQLDIGLTYTAYMSPSAVFGTTHELTLATSWDDSALYGVSWFGGVQPSFTLGFELEGGADGGAHEGIYAGIVLEPTFPVFSSSFASFTVTAPMELGLSALDYYEGTSGDTAFGFFSAGVNMAIGLDFVPAAYGAWELSLGLQAIVLGKNTKVDDDVELVVAGGFGASFD